MKLRNIKMDDVDHTMLGAIQLIGLVILYMAGSLFSVETFKVIAGIGSVLYVANQGRIFYNGFLKKYIIRVIKYFKKPKI